MSNSVVRNGSADEESPLLGGRKPAQSSVVKIRRVLGQEVSRSWADVVLLLCYVVTGLLDSSSTQVWGAFVSMQTGVFWEDLFIPLSYNVVETDHLQETPSMLDWASHPFSILPRQRVSGSPASVSSPSA